MKADDFNDTFFPTPINLASKMFAKVQGFPKFILEPSAGKGHLIEFYKEKFKRGNDVVAIENDRDLRAILREKKITVIDNDFLNFTGSDKFDLIIGNPPFNNGDQHLMKAIDIMYNGQIIFILNAQTIKNPYSAQRKTLVSKLKELGAEIEFHEGLFDTNDSERKTSVEIAIVNITIVNNVCEDIFANMEDSSLNTNHKIEEKYEVSTGKNIEEYVLEYNDVVQTAIDSILCFYKNYNKIGAYISFDESIFAPKSANHLTQLVQQTINLTLSKIRKSFWSKVLVLDEVAKRLTDKKAKDFHQMLQERKTLDFTENNIRQFIGNLINNYSQTMTDATLEIFDKFTIKNSYSGGLYNDNIHLFSGWKTNNAFKVGKKVIIPMSGGYGSGPFIDWVGKWNLHYTAKSALNDIDKVMNFFDGINTFSDISTISQSLEDAFKLGESKRIESTYFVITVFKKGTIHLTFKDENILRRFNIASCLGKSWIPSDYGKKVYNDLDKEEQNVVDEFEGKKVYSENIGQSVFAFKENLLLIQ